MPQPQPNQSENPRNDPAPFPVPPGWGDESGGADDPRVRPVVGSVAGHRPRRRGYKFDPLPAGVMPASDWGED